MDDNAKRRFDAVSLLWKAAGERVAERRKYEWQAAFALWTALAAFTWGILSQHVPIQRTYRTVGALVVGLALTVLHY